MPLRVLIVEDSPFKYAEIMSVLSDAGINATTVVHAINAAHALKAVSSEKFDLLLLDINIPRRLDTQATRGAGLEVLRELDRSDQRNNPSYVIGISEFSDAIEEFGSAFDERLWSIIRYQANSEEWRGQLSRKVRYICDARQSNNFRDGITYGTDVAVICALDSPELDAVRRLPYSWETIKFRHDETRYFAGQLRHDSTSYSVLAAAAPRMGLPAAAALSSKVIHQFRPRLLVMTGICAGRSDKVNLGDVIVADPTWDWGSGKIVEVGKKQGFLPSPHQLDLDPRVIAVFRELSEDRVRLSEIKHSFYGPKPDEELRIHIGPMVSGASVVANEAAFETLLSQHRGIIGLDMESYGVAYACLNNGTPRPMSVIFKGVVDFASSAKDNSYQTYASHVTAGILDYVIPKMLQILE